MKFKCASCDKPFKNDGTEIVSTTVRGGGTSDYLHEDCHYGFLTEWTRNNYMNYEEFLEEIENEEDEELC